MWCAFSCLSDSLVVVATSVGAKPKHGFFHCQHLCATFFRLSADRGRRGNRAMREASTARAPRHAPESCARVAENTCFTRCFRMRRFGAALRASSAARRTTHRARRARAARAAEKTFSQSTRFLRCTTRIARKCANFPAHPTSRNSVFDARSRPARMHPRVLAHAISGDIGVGVAGAATHPDRSPHRRARSQAWRRRRPWTPAGQPRPRQAAPQTTPAAQGGRSGAGRSGEPPVSRLPRAARRRRPDRACR